MPINQSSLNYALKKIKTGWIAGLIATLLTGLAVVLSLQMGLMHLGISKWTLIDVTLSLGLTIGIYFKSRTCAVLLLTYFTFSRFLTWFSVGKPIGLFMSVAFFYFFWQGVVGTFSYHRILKQGNTEGVEDFFSPHGDQNGDLMCQDCGFMVSSSIVNELLCPECGGRLEQRTEGSKD